MIGLMGQSGARRGGGVALKSITHDNCVKNRAQKGVLATRMINLPFIPPQKKKRIPSSASLLHTAPFGQLGGAPLHPEEPALLREGGHGAAAQRVLRTPDRRLERRDQPLQDVAVLFGAENRPVNTVATKKGGGRMKKKNGISVITTKRKEKKRKK